MASDSPSASPAVIHSSNNNTDNHQVEGDGNVKVIATQKDSSADLKIDEKTTAEMATAPSHRSENSVASAPGDKLKTEPIDLELQLRDTDASRNTGALDRNAGDGHDSVAEGQVTDYRTYRRRWFGLVQLTLLNIVVSWDWLTFAPVASSAASYYSTTESNINWLSTAFMFSFVFISPVVIRVLHWGPKQSIMTSATLVLIGNWVRYGGSHSRDGGIYGVVMFGQILTGLAQPFVLAAPTRYSDLWFTNRGRVGATAIMSLANPFGAALGQLIVPFMVEKPADMSQGVLYVSIISTVCCLPAYFIPAAPPTPVAPSSETEKLSLRVSARTALRSLELYLILLPFAFYVGFFNSISTLLNQMLTPYGLSDDEAGIGGALLIVVGLVGAAIISPILDRTKKFLLAIKIAVPMISICYLIFIWMPETRGIEGPYVVLALLGASSFGLLPVALEYLIELSHPISPEVTSVVAWTGGQLLGGCFILISDALQAGDDANPPRNMKNALIFQAVLALVVMPLPLFMGLFGRGDKVAMRRVRSDEEGTRRTA